MLFGDQRQGRCQQDAEHRQEQTSFERSEHPGTGLFPHGDLHDRVLCFDNSPFLRPGIVVPWDNPQHHYNLFRGEIGNPCLSRPRLAALKGM